MKHADLMRHLSRLAVENRPEACLGCGHEHSCSLHGCAVIREAEEQLDYIRENAQALRDGFKPEDTFSRDLVLKMMDAKNLD